MSDPKSTGTHTIVKDFVRRALDEILEVRKDIKAHREEMLERERRFDDQLKTNEMERRSKDDAHDQKLDVLEERTAHLERLIVSAVADLEKSMGDRMTELEKEIAISKAKSGTLGGLSGLGGGGAAAALLKLLGM